jgi:hypothetical protein
MSAEFQVIFTSITTLLAGLALFILKGVYKKFDEIEGTIKGMQEKTNAMGERLVRVETKLDVRKIND